MALVAALTLAGATAASAQVNVGRNQESGLPWTVTAPGGAGWTLVCRFVPVIMEMNQYDRQHWVNKQTQSGRGAASGRLPGQDGRCTLTKTGGAGQVGLALIKNGETRRQTTTDPARPAVVVFM